MIEFQIEDRELRRVLSRVVSSVENPRPLMRAIGEVLVDSTRERFRSSTGPDGRRWERNADTTILNYLRRYSGSFNKSGRLSKKGAGRVMSKRPLIGESRALSTQISYRADRDSVLVGSPMVYAAMQQFGGTRSKFRHLWGDIPARPFLGLSYQDEDSILDAVADFLDV